MTCGGRAHLGSASGLALLKVIVIVLFNLLADCLILMMALGYALFSFKRR
jgi:hypothetical protein